MDDTPPPATAARTGSGNAGGDSAGDGLRRKLSGEWELDPTKSTVDVRSTSFWGLVKVSGRFTGLRGHGSLSEGGDLDGTLIIEAASLDSGNSKRDAHLRSADFFDADNHPSITFTTTGGIRVETDRATVSGELTVAGTTTPLEVPVVLRDVDDEGVTVVAAVDLDRSMWGVGFKKMGMTRMSTPVEVVARFTRIHRQE